MRKIKKILINIVCLFIWHRPTRHRVRDFLLCVNIPILAEYIKFRVARVQPRSALLIEFNDCHGEVTAGFIPYFQRMGYNIDILMNHKTLAERPFCRHDMSRVRVFRTWPQLSRIFLTGAHIKKYQHIILMTSACYFIVKPDGGYGCMLDMFRATGLRLHVIEHDLNDVAEFGEEDLLRQNRLITLGKFDRGVYVNPHLFGDVKISPKNTTTTFIVVGNIEAKRKNFGMLTSALTELAERGADFKVIIVGRGQIENIPAAARRHVEITGRLDFPRLFEKLESADFFLTLLDPDNPAHDRYLTAGVTGSAQMIYGFGKVPLINQKFAAFYRFDDSNAIVYNGTLGDAMVRAVGMSAAEYSEMQQNLKDTATTIADESMKNLKGILNEQ